MNSSFIVDLAMGQIPRSTERISSFKIVPINEMVAELLLTNILHKLLA